MQQGFALYVLPLHARLVKQISLKSHTDVRNASILKPFPLMACVLVQGNKHSKEYATAVWFRDAASVKMDWQELVKFVQILEPLLIRMGNVNAQKARK